MSTSARATAIFDADSGKLEEVAKKIEERLKALQEGFGALKETAVGLFVIEKLPELYEKISEGIREVLETGHHFHDLAANTGASVEELVVLEEQFRAAGKAGEDIQPTLAHMQKALAGGTSDTLIADLGLQMDELRKMTPVQQFQALGRAIAGLQDPAQRSYAAMELFSKSGGTLLAMFKESGGFGDAAERVGEQAEILNQDAALFADASMKFGAVGLKTRGFFVGLADEIVPVLMPLLDKFQNMDLSKIGQEVGSTMAAVLVDPGEIVGDALMLGGVKFLEFLNDGMLTAGTGFMRLLLAAGDELAAKIEGVTADALRHVPGMGNLADRHAAAAVGFERNSKEQAGAALQWQHSGLFDGVASIIGDQLHKDLEKGKAVAGVVRRAELAMHPELPGEGGAEFGNFMPNVSHLASIGGAFGEGGASDPVLESNNILRAHGDKLDQIVRNTAPGGAAKSKPAPFPE